MNGICILVPQANFSDGGIAKLAPLPHTIFLIFIFVLFYWPGYGSCGTATIFFLVRNGCFWYGVEESNNRKKAKIFLSEQITMMTRVLQCPS